jgi:hypothetical protein
VIHAPHVRHLRWPPVRSLPGLGRSCLDDQDKREAAKVPTGGNHHYPGSTSAIEFPMSMLLTESSLNPSQYEVENPQCWSTSGGASHGVPGGPMLTAGGARVPTAMIMLRWWNAL